MNPQVFREYDIRGIVERDFDDDLVVSLGRAYATMLKRAGKATITLGRDCRLSSDRLFGLLSDGLLQSGINVVDIGVVPTPLLYFSVIHWRMDGGAMITGSHNAAEYNGFKLGIGPSTIYGEEIQELRRIIEREDFPPAGPAARSARARCMATTASSSSARSRCGRGLRSRSMAATDAAGWSRRH